MIPTPVDHTANAVARMVGEVRLKLPQHFKQLLDAAIDEGLAKIPLRARAEFKDLVTGQVALTLRASGFADIFNQELERQHETEVTKTKAMEFQRLEAIKNKHADAVGAFEGTMYNRRSSNKAAEQAYSIFQDEISLIDPMESAPLTAWAERLLGNRAKLKGAA